MIIAYLLGELPEHEQEELEARYFGDDALFALVLAIEDELLDRYARGEVRLAEGARFERHFLNSAARRKRLRVAKAWLRLVSTLAADVHRQRLSWWEELMVLLRIKGPD
jgi:anti-sigma factor RsiW